MSDLNEQIRDIANNINDIKQVQIKQKASLDFHIYRTNLNEERIKIMEEIMGDTKSLLNRISGALSFVIGLGIISSLIWTAIQLINYFKEYS